MYQLFAALAIVGVMSALIGLSWLVLDRSNVWAPVIIGAGCFATAVGFFIALRKRPK